MPPIHARLSRIDPERVAGRGQYDDMGGETRQANIFPTRSSRTGFLFRLRRLARCQHFKNADTEQALDDELQVQWEEVGRFAVFDAAQGAMMLEMDDAIILNGCPNYPSNQQIAKHVAVRTIWAEVEMGTFVNEQLQIGNPESD